MLMSAVAVLLSPTTCAASSSPININGDADLAAQASANGWPGNGSASNPYLIANLTINSSGDAIRFMRVGLHVVVANSTLAISNRGLEIQDSSNITFSNNTIVGGYTGIMMECSSGCTVSNIIIYNNTVTTEGTGIIVSSSSDSTVANITISNNSLVGGYTGIIVSSGSGYALSDITLSYITITNNTVSNGGTGIVVSIGCGNALYNATLSHITISNNTFDNDGSGIIVSISSGGSAFNNTFSSIAISNNTINNGGTGMVVASSSGITISNSIISNNTINNGGTGIIVSSSSNTMVLSNTVTGVTYDGIIVPSSINGTISNNTVTCGGSGINAYGSSNCTIANNTMTCGGAGIIASSSSGSTVSNNAISGSMSYGILLDSARNSTAADNDISGPSSIGIVLSSSRGIALSNNTITDSASYGLILDSSSNCTISQNTVTGSGEYGIRSNGANNNSIMGNRIADSTGYGIYLSSGTSIMIYGNVLVDNNGATSTYDPDHVQADDGGDNQWYNETGGNYWSDWQSPDANHDGIVDVPYAIDGGSNLDQLPVTMAMNITAPSSPLYTNISTVAVSGTASDGFGIGAITWYNEATGATGTCSGTSSWSADVPLLEGWNNVTVTMADPMGFSLRDNITVIYSTGPVITTSPESPVYTNQSEYNVRITAPDPAPLTTGNCLAVRERRTGEGELDRRPHRRPDRFRSGGAVPPGPRHQPLRHYRQRFGRELGDVHRSPSSATPLLRR